MSIHWLPCQLSPLEITNPYVTNVILLWMRYIELLDISNYRLRVEITNPYVTNVVLLLMRYIELLDISNYRLRVSLLVITVFCYVGWVHEEDQYMWHIFQEPRYLRRLYRDTSVSFLNNAGLSSNCESSLEQRAFPESVSFGVRIHAPFLLLSLFKTLNTGSQYFRDSFSSVSRPDCHVFIFSQRASRSDMNMLERFKGIWEPAEQIDSM